MPGVTCGREGLGRWCLDNDDNNDDEDDDNDDNDDDDDNGDDVVFQVMDEEYEGEEMYIDSLGQALDLFSPKTFPTAEECMEHCR